MTTKVDAKILVDFKHGRESFSAGEVRKVTLEDLKYFCKAGWAEDPTKVISTENPDKSEVILYTQDINQATTNEVL